MTNQIPAASLVSNTRRILSHLAAAAFLVIGALSLAVGVINATSHGGSKDFQWSIARYLLKHENPYRLYLDYKAGRLVSSPFVASELPVYPASSEVFLWPLAALDHATATWIWAGLNGLFAIGCAVLSARIANLRGPIALCLVGLFLASTPVRNTIGNGQQGLWSLFFLLAAVHCQQQKKSVLAGLFLAASWLKYTITAPLSLIFIRRGSRAPIGVAIGAHIALTLFLGIWMQDNPFRILFSSLMLSDTAQSASMFDVMAIAAYIGAPSIAWSAPIGIALFLAGAIYVVRRENQDDIVVLSLLAMVALLWSYHWQYDYFILVIPFAHALKRWTDGTVQLSDLGIGAAVIHIWFVQRILDSAIVRFPADMIVTLDRGLFWFTCIVLYAALFSYLFTARAKTS